jgi:hypothetical protein
VALASVAAAAVVAALGGGPGASVAAAAPQPASGSGAPAAPPPAAPAAAADAGAAPRAAAGMTRGEAEVLVPPQGTAVEIPVHAGAVCILSFPEAMTASALAGSDHFEIRAWGSDGVAVRASRPHVEPSTLALATKSGSIKVNLTLRVVPPGEHALTLVRFKAATAREALAAEVQAELDRRWAPLAAKLAADRAGLELLIRTRAEELLAERMLIRNDVVPIERHARNDDHVILHVWRALVVGDVGFVQFELQNRSRAPYRPTGVRVVAPDGTDVTGVVRLTTSASARDPAALGVVAPGARVRGIVTLRGVVPLLHRPLSMQVTAPEPGGSIALPRGIVLR